MNNPEDIPANIAEMREWLEAFKQQHGCSWPTLAKMVDVPSGTLSPWMGASYQGNAQNVANKVFKFKQLRESQEAGTIGIPDTPDFIETPTALRIRTLMTIAHSGSITLGCTASGLGKTITMDEYAASVAQAFKITMTPATGSLSALLYSLLRATGSKIERGWARQMSEQIRATLTGRQALIIVDEANHADWQALEELRSLHDLAGVGICLLGNEELYKTIRGGARNHAFARLNSRIAVSHVQHAPSEEDVSIYLDAWSIHPPAMRAMLTKIAMMPGSGALREIREIVRMASMMAQADGTDLSLGHLKDANASRATGSISA